MSAPTNEDIEAFNSPCAECEHGFAYWSEEHSDWGVFCELRGSITPQNNCKMYEQRYDFLDVDE